MAENGQQSLGEDLTTTQLPVVPYGGMEPIKFVVKCGNFAVLVGLHTLPLGNQHDASRFFAEHKEEVSGLIRQAVEHRVTQFLAARHQRGQPRPRKEQSGPASPVWIKGKTFRLAAYFLKRHVNLRCIAKRHSRELRVFPERFVVCASLPEGSTALGGNPNLDVMESGGQSRSEYFSETQDPFSSSAITKRSALQKIARQASLQPPPTAPPLQLQAPPPLSAPMATEAGLSPVQPRAFVHNIENEVMEVKPEEIYGDEEMDVMAAVSGSRSNHSDEVDQDRPAHLEQRHGELGLQQAGTEPGAARSSSGRKRGRLQPGGPREGSAHREAKRPRHGASIQQDGNPNPSPRSPSQSSALGPCGGSLSQSSALGPCGSSLSQSSALGPCGSSLSQSSAPGPCGGSLSQISTFWPCARAVPAAQAEASLEGVRLTHGTQAPRRPLCNSPAEQTNQNRLAASLRGLSVKPGSSASSISSRPAASGEEGRENVPRTSRLRRPKKC